jgi:hypothetical protein
MEIRLTKLKGDFNNIITIRNNVKNVFDILQVRIDKLRQIYSEFIESNKNEMFVFGLDSFHFQSKLIDIEYDDMKRLFLAINNRMYCEYFKLHKIIVEYISKTINDKRGIDLVKINNYPIYKDLEPFKEYKFEVILDIHENILNLLGVIISILNNKENELTIHKTKQNIGLNIDNFITTFNFNLSVIREKTIMFITYIEFFHKMHSKYLKRFSNKIQLMYTHINNDIKFDDSIEISKNKKKELIDEFVSNNVDKELLRDLKTSIGSETNSEVSSTGSKSSLNTPTNLIIDNNDFKFEENHTLPLTDELLKKQVSIKFSPINREKRDIKKLFQKNVHKVSNMLQLCKPKAEDIIEPSISNSDLQKIFSGINQSCDSIINNSNVYIDPNIQKEVEMQYLPIDFENYNDNKEFYNSVDMNSIIDEDINEQTTYEENLTENIKINIDSINSSGEKELIKNIEDKEKQNESQTDIIDKFLTDEEKDIINEEKMDVKNEEDEEQKIENNINKTSSKKKRTNNKKKK